MFKVGDKVACIFGLWKNTNGVTKFVAPEKFEIVRIHRMRVHNDKLVLSFEEYPSENFYASHHFRPLDRSFSDFIIAEIFKTRHIAAK